MKATETLAAGTENQVVVARAQELQRTFPTAKVTINGSTDRGFEIQLKMRPARA